MKTKSGGCGTGVFVLVILGFFGAKNVIHSIRRSPSIVQPAPTGPTPTTPTPTGDAEAPEAPAEAPEAPAEATATETTSLILILDTSGSMDETVEGGGTKLQYAKQVLTEDFLPLLADDLKVGLYTFAGGDSTDYAKKKRRFVRQPAALARNSRMDKPRWTHREACMDYVEQATARGGTPIAESMRLAGGALMKLTGRKIIVLVTDGEESYEGKGSVLSIVNVNRDAGIETYVVGFNLGNQGAYLKEKLGLGKAYFEANGGRPALLAAMQSILAAIEK
jgi:Ca-activated chloride channel family protein